MDFSLHNTFRTFHFYSVNIVSLSMAEQKRGIFFETKNSFYFPRIHDAIPHSVQDSTLSLYM